MRLLSGWLIVEAYDKQSLVNVDPETPDIKTHVIREYDNSHFYDAICAI